MNYMISHDFTNNKNYSKMTDEGTVGAPTCSTPIDFLFVFVSYLTFSCL
jgi:hypothetical protein